MSKLPSLCPPQPSAHAAPRRAGPLRHVRTVLEWAAVASAVSFIVLLGARQLTTPDLGYHLAYGEEFFRTGRPVDHNPYVYLHPASDLERELAPPGPGAWYDADGRYRFANANWLTQILMSGVHRVGGERGLWLALPAMVAGLAALTILAMRRCGVPWLAVAAAVVVLAGAAYPRFLMRPELPVFVLMAAQVAILIALADPARRVSWAAAGALVGLQLLQVNLHSYWPLGLGLIGAVFADRAARFAWKRLARRRTAGPAAPEAGATTDLRRLAIALGGAGLASFVNPWTWRLAVLPWQTLRFMRENRIAQPGPHPWTKIGEFFSPFSGYGADMPVAYVALWVVLIVGALGLVAALLRRRWSWALMIAGMAVVAVSMRRNVAPGAVVIVPVAVAACWGLVRPLAGRVGHRVSLGVVMAAAVAVTAAGAVGSWSVATQRFHVAQLSVTRTGVGFSRMQLSLPAVRWVNEHQPQGGLWCDYLISSNVHYFTRPHRDVPLLTNTWAYPPAAMEASLLIHGGYAAYEPLFERYGIDIVVLRMAQDTAPLARALDADPDWALVHLDVHDVIFLRDAGPNAELVARWELRPDTIDVQALMRNALQLDGQESFVLQLVGVTLQRLEWFTPAAEIFQHIVDRDPEHYGAHARLGACLAHRAIAHFHQGQRSGHAVIRFKIAYEAQDELEAASVSLRRALELRPDRVEIRDELRQAQAALAEIGAAYPRPARRP